MKLIAILPWILLLTLVSCNKNLSKSRAVNKQSPPSFRARFETTKGNIVIEFQREWSPAGVDRVYQLVRSGFFNNIAIFRVVKNFVAQFGISDDSTKNIFWQKHLVADEQVVMQNSEGTVSFARSGPKSRGTQLFINLKNNSPYLDTLAFSGVKGFPVIGRILDGKAIVDSLYSGYEEKPNQDSISRLGNKYLLNKFPKLDYIKKVIMTK